MSNSPTSNSERRKFSRITFDAQTQLTQGNTEWPAQLLDISLKGLLLKCQLPEAIDAGQAIQAQIILSDLTMINMTLVVAHREAEQLGLNSTSIDIDSVSHLRRLLELNLGNSEAAERELSELMHEPE